MALVLSLKEGDDFFVGHERYVVSGIVSPKEFILRKAKDGAETRVIEGRTYSLGSNVNVFVGGRGQLQLARVAFEAPRSVPILTGDKYRERPPA